MRGVGKLGRFMLISGLLILGIYLGARVYATFSSRSEARRLENRPPASRQPVAQEHAAGLSFVLKEPDFSLWSPQRIKHYQASLAAQLGPPTQVRHWEGQKRVKSFEISLGYGRVCTTFLNLERL